VRAAASVPAAARLAGVALDAYKARRADDRTRPEAVAWLESEPDY